MSICYLLPETVKNKSITSDIISERYEHLKPLFPKAATIVQEGDWGIMIQFSGSIAGCNYSELYFEPTVDMELELRTDGQLISHMAIYSGSTTFSGQGKSIYLQPGLQALHYFPADAIYTALVLRGTAFHIMNISSEPTVIKELESSFPKLKAMYEHYKSGSQKHLSLPHARLRVNARQIIKLMYTCTYDSAARNVYFRSRINDYLLIYLFQVHRSPEAEIEILHSRHQEISAMIAEIKRKPEISFNLGQKAEEIGISQRLLQKAFKNLTGTTAKDYVTLQRIAKAKFLLKKTGLTAAEISSQLGFVEPAYFNKLFKERTGITPMQYRSRNN